MTSTPDSFPDQISLASLQQLIETAETQATNADISDVQLSQEKVEEICLNLVDHINDKSETHMIPKVLVLMLLKGLANWAETNHESAKAADDMDSACQFYSMQNELAHAAFTIQNTFMGPDDFTHPSYES